MFHAWVTGLNIVFQLLVLLPAYIRISRLLADLRSLRVKLLTVMCSFYLILQYNTLQLKSLGFKFFREVSYGHQCCIYLKYYCNLK